MLQKTEFNKCEREMTKDEEENVRSLLSWQGRKKCSRFWSPCMLLNTCRKIRPKRGADDGWWRKRTRRMRGVKKQNEKYSLLFSTHLFSQWLLLVENETYYYVCEEGFFQSSALGFMLEKYFRKWDYCYCELTKVFFTPLAKIRLNLQNQEQVSSTAMWI